MKLIMKSIAYIVLVVCSVICALNTIPKTKTVDEFVVMRAEIVQTTQTENENEFKYEIITDDGNIWIIYGNENLPPKTNLITVFYTFQSNDFECWEVLDYWATQK